MILLFAILYLLIVAAVYCFQRRLLYFPAHIPNSTAALVAKNCGFEPWQNSIGEIIGWKYISKNPGPRNSVLITHGNAGCAIHRIDLALALNQAGTFDANILEYPGYGDRAGSPSKTSILDAADEAILLLEKNGPIYLIGESLGTGVASYLAGEHPKAVAGVLLIAPYHNLAEVAQFHFRVLPAKWILKDNFTSAEYLRDYHGPVAIMLAGQDVVVPNQFGRRLFDSYKGPKKLWEFPEAGHDTLSSQPAAWWQELVRFWKNPA